MRAQLPPPATGAHSGDLGSVPRLGTRLLFSPLPEKPSTYPDTQAGRWQDHLHRLPWSRALRTHTEQMQAAESLSSTSPVPFPHHFPSSRAHTHIRRSSECWHSPSVLPAPLPRPIFHLVGLLLSNSPILRFAAHSALTLTLTSCSSLKLASEYTYTQQKTPLAPAPDASTPVAPVAGAHWLQLLPPQPGGVCAPSPLQGLALGVTDHIQVSPGAGTQSLQLVDTRDRECMYMEK